MDPFFHLVVLAATLAGASCGLLGVYVVGLRLPFIGICISHAAMAGTIFSFVLGLNPVWGPVAFSAIASVGLAALRPDRLRLDPGVILAILFSVMLGLTFIGFGLMQGSRSEVLGLLWGSILFVKKQNVVIITLVAIILAIFALVFSKEMKVLLFSRPIAAATGVHETFVYCMFLALCGTTLAVNLPLVGGLMIFSLITCPAAAAYQLCRGYRAVVTVSPILGALSALGGFLASYFLNLPTGACIVIAAAAIFGVAAAYRAFWGRID